MIVQITGPVAPPLPFSPSFSSPSIPIIHSANSAYHIHSMRRVLSSPPRDQTRPRGPSDPSNSSRQRSYPRTVNGREHECTDDYFPSFLRDQQSTNTKQAIKQMAEHRVLLQAHKLSSPSSELSEEDSEDDYAWYLKNPHRYLRRPRDRSAKNQRRRMVLYGEMVEERDDETNRQLFAAYVLRHYGVILFWEGQDCPDGPRRHMGAAERASTSPSSGPRVYWNDADGSDEDESTLFWADEYDIPSSPTLGTGSIRHPRCSEASSSDGKRDSLLTASSELPSLNKPTKTTPYTSPTNPKERRSEGKRSSFFRSNPTRVRSGSHRRFSFLRIFSS